MENIENMENKNISNGWEYASVGCGIMQALTFLTAPMELLTYSNIFNNLMFIFIVVDAILLKQAKFANVPSFWWGLIPPVYYFKRQKALNRPMTLFYINLGSIIAIFVFLFLRIIFYTISQYAAMNSGY